MFVVLARTELLLLRIITVSWGRLDGCESLVYEQTIDGEWRLVPTARQRYDNETLAREGHALLVERYQKNG